LLQGLALGHAAVGTALYRRELGRIGAEGVLGGVPYKGEKATAFWFLVPVPLVWIVGDLMARAEAQGDAEALRAASAAGLVASAGLIACVPVSGFWAWLGVSLRGLRDARRMAGR
jgi:hypothetical protein